MTDGGHFNLKDVSEISLMFFRDWILWFVVIASCHEDLIVLFIYIMHTIGQNSCRFLVIDLTSFARETTVGSLFAIRFHKAFVIKPSTDEKFSLDKFLGT